MSEKARLCANALSTVFFCTVCWRTDDEGIEAHRRCSALAFTTSAMQTQPRYADGLFAIDETECSRLLAAPDAKRFRLDASGHILTASTGFCEMLGLRPDAIAGRELIAFATSLSTGDATQLVLRLLLIGHLRHGELPLTSTHGGRYGFAFQSIARLEGDGQLIECRADQPNDRQQAIALSPVTRRRPQLLDAADMESAIEHACRQTRSTGVPLTLLKVAIDGVKAPAVTATGTVSTSSHSFGERLMKLVRMTDVVGQVEHAAFIILLPGASAREALRSAERLRTAVVAMPVSSGERPVTISVSTVTTRTGRAPYRTLRLRLDAKCEEAQSKGGNRVVP